MNRDLFCRWKKMTKAANFAATVIVLGGVFFLLKSGYSQERPVKYTQVRIYLTSQNEIAALQRAGLGLDHVHVQENYLEAVLNDQDVALLKNTAQRYDVVIDDLEADYRSRPRLTPEQLRAFAASMQQQYNLNGFNFGSMGGYYTFNEVAAELDEMRAQYPNLISVKQSLGNSLEGRAIWMVKISDNPGNDESEEEVLYTALHHAREPQSMATLIYFMWHLLENYGADPDVNFVVENRELYFVPAVNPDGYVYNQTTNPNGGGFWRKNRRNNGNGTLGVDLNRNYGYRWGFDNNGSSPNTGSETYRGAGPFSEPETQVIRNFASARNFARALNYHSYGSYLIFPWGYQPSLFTPDHASFVALAQDMTQFNHYDYGTANQTVGYVVNGEANDWFYGEQTLKNKVLGMTPEVGSFSDGFWPAMSRIIPLAEENVYPNMVLARGLSLAPPAIMITLTPANPPIIIPPGGGNFGYSVRFENTSATAQTFQYWNLFTLPNGTSSGPTVGPTSLTLGAGQATTRNFTQRVRRNSPAGPYTLHFQAGTYPNTIIDRESFTFTKQGLPVLSGAVSFADDIAGEPVLERVAGERAPHLLHAQEDEMPRAFVLEPSYPNPFSAGNPSTAIRFGLKTESRVTLQIFDLLGHKIVTLASGPQRAGYHTVTWDGRNQAGQQVANGVYLYKMTVDGAVQTHKMFLAR